MPRKTAPIGDLWSHLERRSGKRLQPGGDVDPVAEKIGAVDEDVADMHANTQQHRLVGDTASVRCSYRGLHRDGALDGIHRTGEVRRESPLP
jgi:hypothetical protein